MADPATNGTSKGSFSAEMLFKVLPYILLVAGYLVGWGKRDNNVDVVVQQLGEQRTAIAGLADRVQTLSDRISKIEGSQDSLRRDVDQEHVYQSGRSK